ncbi:unnamed protein product [Moneuplotes crassus]|uniref:Kinesin motor domain-containing protein n=1 Tax=Euplotes crassus TaxID=5936 RepID=A0AAD1XCK7_EUPCR|nr:unnamed protein product [Moneuplotes crassus]
METYGGDFQHNIQIATAVRIKPIDALQTTQDCVLDIAGCPSSNTVTCTSTSFSSAPSSPKVFSVNRVFDEYSTQQEVYSGAVASMVESFLCGCSSTVMCYGGTQTGKTHTLSSQAGSDGEKEYTPGMIELSLREVFSRLHKFDKYLLKFEYYMVWNETLYDLFDDEDCLREIKPKDSCFKGIYGVESIEQALDLIDQANLKSYKLRADLDMRRVHMILRMSLDVIDHDEDGLEISHSVLSFVDLPSCSRMLKTGASNNLLKECQKVSQSLSAICNVLWCLKENKYHIPFRDSKTTYLLSDSLNKNSRVLMIGCISLVDTLSYDSLPTLRYLSRFQTSNQQPEALMNSKNSTLVKLILTSKKINVAHEGKEVPQVEKFLKSLLEVLSSDSNLPEPLSKSINWHFGNKGRKFMSNLIERILEGIFSEKNLGCNQKS